MNIVKSETDLGFFVNKKIEYFVEQNQRSWGKSKALETLNIGVLGNSE